MRRNSYYALGSLLDIMGQPAQAFASHAMAKRLTDHSETASHEEREFLGKVNSGMGLALLALGRYDEARVCFQTDLQITTSLFGSASASPQPEKIGNCYCNLGELEKIQGHYMKALAHYRQHLDLVHESQDSHDRELARRNVEAAERIIVLEKELNESKTIVQTLKGPELITHLRRLLTDCTELPQRHHVNAIAHQLMTVAEAQGDDVALGEACAELGVSAAMAKPPNKEDALLYHQRALTLAEKRNDHEGQLVAKIELIMLDDDDDNQTNGEDIITRLNDITDAASKAKLLEIEHTALENMECIARKYGRKARLPEFASRLTGVRKRIKAARRAKGEDTDDDDIDDEHSGDEFKGSDDENKSDVDDDKRTARRSRPPLFDDVLIDSDDDANEASSSDAHDDDSNDGDVTDPDASQSQSQSQSQRTSGSSSSSSDDDDDIPLLQQAQRAAIKQQRRLRRLDANGQPTSDSQDGGSQKRKKKKRGMRLKKWKVTRLEKEAAAKKQAAKDAIENARRKRQRSASLDDSTSSSFTQSSIGAATQMSSSSQHHQMSSPPIVSMNNDSSQEDMPIPFSPSDGGPIGETKETKGLVASHPTSSSSIGVVDLDTDSDDNMNNNDDDDVDRDAFAAAVRTRPSLSSSSVRAVPLEPFLDTEEDDFVPSSLPSQSHRRKRTTSPSAISQRSSSSNKDKKSSNDDALDREGEAIEVGSRQRSRLANDDEPNYRVRSRAWEASVPARRRQQVSFGSIRGTSRPRAIASGIGSRRNMANASNSSSSTSAAMQRRRRTIDELDDLPSDRSRRSGLSFAIAARLEAKADMERRHRDPLAYRRALIQGSGRPELVGNAGSVIERASGRRQRYPIRRPRKSNIPKATGSGLPRLLAENSDDDKHDIRNNDNDDDDDDDVNEDDADDTYNVMNRSNGDGRSTVPQPQVIAGVNNDDEMPIPLLEPEAPALRLPPYVPPGSVAQVANGPLLGVVWRIAIDGAQLFVRQLPNVSAAGSGVVVGAEESKNDTVAWLLGEAQDNYYRSHGRRPVLEYLSVDGGIIEPHYPLSAVPSNADPSRPLITGMVASWTPVSLSLYYEHLCSKQRHCAVNDRLLVWLRELEHVDPQSGAFTSAKQMMLPHYIGCTPANTLPFMWIFKEAIDIESLSLAHNIVGDECADALAKCIPRDDRRCTSRGLWKLRSLSLAATSITDQGFAHLLPALARLPHLTTLDLSQNQLTDASLPALAELLSKTQTLLHLNLSHCPLTGADPAAFGVALSSSNSLRHLSLEHTYLTPQSLASLFKHMTDASRPLTVLNLNSIPSMMIVTPPSTSTSTSTSLSSSASNEVMTSQALAIDGLRALLSGRALPHIPTPFGLIELHISGWSDSCDRLSFVIEDAIESSWCRLERIELRFNHFSVPATRRVCSYVSKSLFVLFT
jgi:tetratricopeptide (TPR) repeat protein